MTTPTDIQTRLQSVREYRSRLINEVHARIDKFHADGKPAEQFLEYANYIDLVNDRVRVANYEVDRLMEMLNLFLPVTVEVTSELQAR